MHFNQSVKYTPLNNAIKSGGRSQYVKDDLHNTRGVCKSLVYLPAAFTCNYARLVVSDFSKLLLQTNSSILFLLYSR